MAESGDAVPRTTLTRAGVRLGLRQAAPLGVSTAVFGLAFGALARQVGLSAAEATLMSVTVWAGTAQFLALDLWANPPPTLSLLLTTLVVNARHLLMGASLQPDFATLPKRRVYPMLFWLADETWALTTRALAGGRRDAGILLGAGLCLYVGLIGATATGAILGAAIERPERWGLDVAFVALFAALLLGSWRGPRSLPPWAVGAGVAVLAGALFADRWSIVLGGVAGTLVGALTERDGKPDVG